MLLDVPAAAEYSGLSERHLRRLIDERRIGFVKERRRVFLLRSDLDDFVARNRIEPEGRRRR